MQPQSCFVTCHSRQNISCCLLEDALQRTALHVGVWCMVPGRCWRFLATCREKRRFRRHLCLTRGYGTASAGREVTIRLCLCHTFSTERVRVLSHSHTSHTCVVLHTHPWPLPGFNWFGRCLLMRFSPSSVLLQHLDVLSRFHSNGRRNSCICGWTGLCGHSEWPIRRWMLVWHALSNLDHEPPSPHVRSSEIAMHTDSTCTQQMILTANTALHSAEGPIFQKPRHPLQGIVVIQRSIIRPLLWSSPLSVQPRWKPVISTAF
ncbi:hypothetical protein F4823DRAFT_491461 [Ustulina deusta]|nr:hypothetical protein F4823DRAFT_491461 [Ustulina deusta]